MGEVWEGIRFAEKNRDRSFENVMRARTNRDIRSYRGRREDRLMLQMALTNLDRAGSSLQRANADKGGHRRNALTLIDQAKREVRARLHSTSRPGGGRPHSR